MKLLILALLCLRAHALYYDGLTSYTSLSFDFTVSASANKYSSSASSPQATQGPKLLLFARQHGLHDFSVKLTSDSLLQISDFWSTKPVSIKLPADFMTSWFRLVYSRTHNTADITLYKFEASATLLHDDQLPKLVRVFAKQKTLNNYASASGTGSANSQLLVGGVDSDQLNNVAHFHGYIMNLQYTSDYSSQCLVNDVCLRPDGHRQYALFSSSSSKKHSSKQSLMIDDICESDTLVHDMCPRDCACFSNNFRAPFFSCDCQAEGVLEHAETEQCSLMFKSLGVNFDDPVYFGGGLKKFEYPMLASMTRVDVESMGAVFDGVRGVGFRSPAAHVNLEPAEEFLDAETACFWNVENCESGFVQHMVMSVDLLDEGKFQQKVVLFVNGKKEASKLVGYVQNGRLHFSVYEASSGVEWLVSSPVLTRNYLNRPIKVSETEKTFYTKFSCLKI